MIFAIMGAAIFCNWLALRIRAYLKFGGPQSRLLGAFHTQALHEAGADLHRIAVGGADARLVVDAHGNQARPALERGGEQAVEVVLVGGPGAVGEPEPRAMATRSAADALAVGWPPVI